MTLYYTYIKFYDSRFGAYLHSIGKLCLVRLRVELGRGEAHDVDLGLDLHRLDLALDGGRYG